MPRFAHALVLGAALGFVLPLAAQGGQGLPGADRTGAQGPIVHLAQYDGQDYDAGPYGPYPSPAGPGPGYPGPYGRPPFGPDQGGPGGAPLRSGARTGERVSYHGFRIDLSDAAGNLNVAGEIAAVEHQIDIVDSVGLSASNLRLFRSMPIRVSNGLSGGGHYGGGSFVVIGNLLTTDARPILLHEYMHVLHFRRFSGGFHNPTIRRFYEEALANNLYPAGSYMLSNPAEFFAMTASCYLYGTVARPPYNRDTIRTQQPDYYAYLEQLFGRARTSRVGSGTAPTVAGPITLARPG